MFKKVLVPLDGSLFSNRALPYAIDIAKRFNAEVVLLQVVRETPMISPAVSSEATAMASPEATQIIVESAKQQDKRKIGRAKRYLRTKLKQVTAHGINATYQAMLGEPAKTIIKFSKKESIDLVVMTTSGKSGLKRAFLGSVADEVIREPGIPVLAIRPKRRIKKK